MAYQVRVLNQIGNACILPVFGIQNHLFGGRKTELTALMNLKIASSFLVGISQEFSNENERVLKWNV